MGKIITTDIYTAAFLIMNGAILKLKWFGNKCEFTLDHSELDKLISIYEKPGNNVNAKLFISHYKEVARRVKNTK